MRPWARGFLIAVIQMGLVASLGGKLLYDRLSQPRVWVRAVPYDPSLPVRGRYVRLELMVAPAEPGEAAAAAACEDKTPVSLQVHGKTLIAVPTSRQHPYEPGDLHLKSRTYGATHFLVLDKTVAFFIPENLPEVTLPRWGQELWVEVSVPRTGPPRPIRLGHKEGDGPIIPIRTKE